MADPRHIRNFSIVAHIDHGKSTLADRFLELTGAITAREKKDQFLDQMDLERERGITIKAQTVRLDYRAKDGQNYIFNLIDTPGHVDFHYEVSRSLAACEGAILLVDVSQGVEAQTVANYLTARDQGLEILPVINKVDLDNTDIEGAKHQIEDILGLDTKEILLASGKTGRGIPEMFEAIVRKLPPPKGLPQASLRALILDSWFNSYQGVIVLIRVVDGRIQTGQKIRLMHVGKDFEVQKLGVFRPAVFEVNSLGAGEVGFCIAGIKNVVETRIGDTIIDSENMTAKPLPGFKAVKPFVFAGIYPTDSEQYGDLKGALEKLRLNDASFTFEPETSQALGFGFRCGFLGSLHMEIIQERLE
ncbi:MAG: elongation factor 4, partial [Deltaproteobacteria bacterium]|nr:elongation factor 4 [Deltaproteobacteria bacterium]